MILISERISLEVVFTDVMEVVISEMISKLSQVITQHNKMSLIINMPMSGFEPATQWSETQHTTSGLPRPPWGFDYDC